MTSAFDPHAGATVTGLFLGSLAIAGAVALVTAPITPRIAEARTVAGQQAAGTLDGGSLAADRAEVMSSDGRVGRVDPLGHPLHGYRWNIVRD